MASSPETNDRPSTGRPATGEGSDGRGEALTAEGSSSTPAGRRDGPAIEPSLAPADAPVREPVRPRPASAPSRLALVLVAILAGTTLFVGGFTLGARVATTPGTPAAEEQQFTGFWDVYDMIKNRYAGSPRPSGDALVVAAIKGMLESLNDPWSYYQAPEDYQNANLSVAGQAQGIGVVVQIQPRTAGSSATCSNTVNATCELAINSVFSGAPADKAGLKAGDVIEAVDDASLDGLTTDDITKKIKGTAGTPVTLTIGRGLDTLRITIIRGSYVLPQVSTQLLANGAVESIKVTGVNDNSAADFKKALEAALAKGIRSFILDLRGNTGGYVNSAATIAGEFLNGGIVCYQQDASGKISEVAAPVGGPAVGSNVHLVVLVDGNTASAAEIVSGALQSRGRAQLVGEKTYGKGVVQEWLPLPNDMGGFHLTIARWLTPDKVWINGKGLQPDIAVNTAGARAGTDPVLDAGLKALGYPGSAGASASPGASATPVSPPAPSVSPAPSLVPSPSATAS